MKWTLVLCLVITYKEVEMANILALLPLPLYSHTSNFMPIFKALASRGHNVTMVSPFPQKTPVPNLTDIVVSNNLKEMSRNMPAIDLTQISERYFQLVILWYYAGSLTEIALSNEIVQKLIRDKESKFDLIMIETFMFQEPLLAFGHKFQAPVINLNPGLLTQSAAYYTGNSVPYPYSPSRFSSFTDRMTFLQRVETAFFHTWELLVNTIYFQRRQDNLMRKYLEHDELQNLPPLIEMLKNTSLTLINHNSAVGYPIPLHRNVVEFGGINVKSGEKLPKDLQEMMDKATEGVIYFNFGSFYNVSTLSEDVQVSIMSALGKVKQKVLIKWENPRTDGKLPANIEFRKWYPQSSVLAHPNCKLFITHGGLASLMEAIYHAVPVLIIPLYADQKYNAKIAERYDIGQVLHLNDLKEDNLLNSINTVFFNSRYKENIRKHSAIFRDQPMNILDNVIYWIEYVIRHKGAPHLRPAVLDLHWYQYLMLDVIVFYLFIIFVIVYIVKKVVFLIFTTFRRLLCKHSCKKDVKKSKNE